MKAKPRQAATDEKSWTTRSLRLLAIVTLVRLSLIAAHAFELSASELILWDFGRYKELGYVETAPMLPWLLHLADMNADGSFFSLKLVPCLLSAIGLWAIFMAGKSVHSSRFGFWALATTLVLPWNWLNAMIATPTSGTACFWSLAIFAVAKAYARKDNSFTFSDFLFLGTTLGLGLLCSPHMAGFVVLLLGFTLRFRVKWLKIPRFYLSILLGFAFLIPTFSWLIKHEIPLATYFNPMRYNGSASFLFSPTLWLTTAVFSFVLWVFAAESAGKKFALYLYGAVLVIGLAGTVFALRFEALSNVKKNSSYKIMGDAASRILAKNSPNNSAVTLVSGDSETTAALAFYSQKKSRVFRNPSGQCTISSYDIWYRENFASSLQYKKHVFLVAKDEKSMPFVNSPLIQEKITLMPEGPKKRPISWQFFLIDKKDFKAMSSQVDTKKA